ncbi:L-aspartate oxidase [Devosia sp. Root685]|uniref:L-aspartate oxidase n=1 Tax=Devosia sp. Root685 TaxID=1736587 RepID=UPI0006F1E54A|nr:L-aspartate oxidase [Devosia sp. Root685]KRB01243.1 L-aspartate oxidase [Devosia sp. Root685]
MSQRDQNPVIVIGGGIAGLATALRLWPLPVVLIAAAPLGRDAATALAQGGIAAALGRDDAPRLHADDAIAAAAGLGDPDVTRRIADAGPAAIAWLLEQGIDFDLASDGSEIALGLEAAHSRRRIVHAGGDRTGRRVIDGLIKAVRATPSIAVLEGRVLDLARTEHGRVAGVVYMPANRRPSDAVLLRGRGVVLATGGIGGLYAHTTNPVKATGTGVALAARAGAVLRDLEFVQFHPTAIAIGRDPMPLATEALRGEGAILVNARGERFMETIAGAELAPRDIVASAVFRQITAGEDVFLDTRPALGQAVHTRFPGFSALCASGGLDPASQPIPIRPAAHYHMGGVKVGASGQTTVPGLWACGEVASTGLHGANRLASNSLLEAVVQSASIAEDIKSRTFLEAACLPPSPGLSSPGQAHASLRRQMDRDVGVVRDAAGLQRAARDFWFEVNANPARGADTALVALLIAISAERRHESRGAHQRADHPRLSTTPRHTEITLTEALDSARELAESRTLAMEAVA